MRFSAAFVEKEVFVTPAVGILNERGYYGYPVIAICAAKGRMYATNEFIALQKKIDAGQLVEVVRCKDCVNAVPLDRNCELNTSTYMHCSLLRGEETKNVWHKYKKYYKDYSLVDRDDFCSSGERIDDT